MRATAYRIAVHAPLAWEAESNRKKAAGNLRRVPSAGTPHKFEMHTDCCNQRLRPKPLNERYGDFSPIGVLAYYRTIVLGGKVNRSASAATRATNAAAVLINCTLAAIWGDMKRLIMLKTNPIAQEPTSSRSYFPRAAL